jgi:UDP-N-acetylmuramoyl-tripeptide--D-alanyl-D-alanine ligase
LPTLSRAERELEDASPVIVVQRTAAALARLAADERKASGATVIGITGSSGKTTTKDLMNAVLSTRMPVKSSPGSYNNEIGLPLTLLSASEDTRAIICEMGSRGKGHIADLCEIASPDMGVVTNVGVAHMELFGTPEILADAKAELVEALPRGGTAVINIDDSVVRGFSSRTRAKVLTFGRSSEAAVRAESVELTDSGTARFELVFESQRELTELSIPGEHMVSNALAASAAGVAMDVPLADASGALREVTASTWRMETFTDSRGVVVINDAYNANPSSMAAALKTARWMARGSRMVAVLGQMAELGEISRAEHERIGELAARLRVERLITVGDSAEDIAAAAIREGVEPENVAAYGDPESALADVVGWVRPGDVVLFKASRVVGLERMAEAMR